MQGWLIRVCVTVGHKSVNHGFHKEVQDCLFCLIFDFGKLKLHRFTLLDYNDTSITCRWAFQTFVTELYRVWHHCASCFVHTKLHFLPLQRQTTPAATMLSVKDISAWQLPEQMKSPQRHNIRIMTLLSPYRTAKWVIDFLPNSITVKRQETPRTPAGGKQGLARDEDEQGGEDDNKKQ